MSQNNSNDKAAMLAKIEGINEVEGFDPTPFAVDYTDLETGAQAPPGYDPDGVVSYEVSRRAYCHYGITRKGLLCSNS